MTVPFLNMSLKYFRDFRRKVKENYNYFDIHVAQIVMLECSSVQKKKKKNPLRRAITDGEIASNVFIFFLPLDNINTQIFKYSTIFRESSWQLIHRCREDSFSAYCIVYERDRKRKKIIFLCQTPCLGLNRHGLYELLMTFFKV